MEVKGSLPRERVKPETPEGKGLDRPRRSVDPTAQRAPTD